MGKLKTKPTASKMLSYRNLINSGSPLLIFFGIAALYLFSYSLRKIVTPDEFAWVIQSIHFRQALIELDWPRMVQSAHPGFITMWIGSIGTTIKLWFQPELQTEITWILEQSWHLPQTGELSARLHPFLQPSRNALSLLMAGLWTAVYALLKQRYDLKVALITTLILVTDLWIVGLTNILHVDGLLAMFCLLTLLLVLPRRDDELSWYSNRRYLLAGVTMAGAILSKVPGLLLLAVVPTILLVQWWFLRRSAVRADGVGTNSAPKNEGFSRPRPPLLEARPPLHVLFSVLIGLLLTIALFAPIILINPNHVFQNVFVLSTREVGFSAPTFFLGQVTENPGILFYPLTILFRQRAIITLGLIIGVVQLIRTKNGRKQWLALAAVGTFCLLFWIGLLVSDREFARYALPIYLMVALIGAITFAQFALTFEPTFHPQETEGYELLQALPYLLIASTLLFFPKEPFSFINPLVGGPWNGPNLMLTGWGGAQSYAAAGLSANKNTVIFTDNVPATAPFVQYPNNVTLLTEETAWLIKPTDAVILSLEHQQLNPDLWQLGSGSDSDAIIGRLPLYKHLFATERYAFRDRAWVFLQFDPELLNRGLARFEAADFRFNSNLHLTEATTIKPDDDFNIHLLLRWSQSQPEDGILQFTIVDTAGNVWIQREDPLINIEDISAGRWTRNTGYLSIHSLPLASDMPPGDYSVRVSHFRPDGSLSGVDQNGAFIGTVANLATFPVTVPAPQPPVAMPEDTLNHHHIQAVSELPATIGQGETFTADVWLKAAPPLPPNLQLDIGSQTVSHLLDTTAWQDDFVYRIRARWQIPADMPPGDHNIRINNIELGTLTVEPRERNFDPPAGLSAAGPTFGDIIRLVVVEPNQNDQSNIRIVWQAIDSTPIDYTMFIHLKDGSENIVAQQDTQPGKPTSQTISGEVIDFTAEFSLSDIDKETVSTVAIGFYNPATGQRLPVLSESGERLPDDQVEIIIWADEN